MEGGGEAVCQLVKISAVNTDRKLQQTAAGAGLRKEEADYYETLHKNMQIELACDRLEAHMHALRGAQPAGKAAAAAPENGAAAQVAVEVEAAGAAGAAAAEMEVEAAVEAVAAVAVAVEAVAVAGEMETEAEAAAEAEAGVEQ
ncbi:hypothetical protein FOA52_008547 [Chlamydomonas sp. UWO 241]|nr:hypothetical protein FOA52_008547 [Chlamydomonas sp. UWO 241]